MNETVKLQEILSKLNISEADLKKMIQEGKFPQPDKINNSVPIWSYAILENWIKNKAIQNDWVHQKDLDFL